MIIILCGLAATTGIITIVRGWNAPQRKRRQHKRPTEFEPTHPSPVKGRLIGQLAIGVGAGALGMWMTGLPGMALLFGGLGVLLPPFLAAPRHRREASRLAGSWEELTRQIAELARAGATLPDAFAASARHAPEELRPLMEAAAVKLQVHSMEAALDELGTADKLWAPRCVAALRVAHRSGGPAATALLDIGKRIRDQVDLHRIQTEAVVRIWTQTIALLVVSFGVIMLMWRNNPDYFLPYSQGAGQMVLVLIAGVLLGAIGYLVRNSVVRQEESVLIPPTERELKQRKEPL